MVQHLLRRQRSQRRAVLLHRRLQPNRHGGRDRHRCISLGLGGWLSVDGSITEYFATQLTQADSEKFGIPLADACGQQVWEALAMLTAIDLWPSTWKQRRIVFKITGDNVTALTLVTKMRPPSKELAITARELTLRLAELSFPPDAQHTPGVGHIFADSLSRVYAPTGA